MAPAPPAPAGRGLTSQEERYRSENGRRDRSYPLGWRREKLRWALISQLTTADVRDITDWLIDQATTNPNFDERMAAVEKLLSWVLGKEQAINLEGDNQRQNVTIAVQQIMRDPAAREVIERMADDLDVTAGGLPPDDPPGTSGPFGAGAGWGA
jgi:hypothetical protein